MEDAILTLCVQVSHLCWEPSLSILCSLYYHPEALCPNSAITYMLLNLSVLGRSYLKGKKKNLYAFQESPWASSPQ